MQKPSRLCLLTSRRDLPPFCDENGPITVRKFNDSTELIKAATPCRIELMDLIRTCSPTSLYELAKLAGKNQAYIYREAKILKGLGLIEFESAIVDGRRRVKPLALYDGVLLWI